MSGQRYVGSGVHRCTEKPKINHNKTIVFISNIAVLVKLTFYHFSILVKIKRYEIFNYSLKFQIWMVFFFF